MSHPRRIYVSSFLFVVFIVILVILLVFLLVVVVFPEAFRRLDGFEGRLFETGVVFFGAGGAGKTLMTLMATDSAVFRSKVRWTWLYCPMPMTSHSLMKKSTILVALVLQGVEPPVQRRFTLVVMFRDHGNLLLFSILFLCSERSRR